MSLAMLAAPPFDSSSADAIIAGKNEANTDLSRRSPRDFASPADIAILRKQQCKLVRYFVLFGQHQFGAGS
jgi:hypothetical protein